MTPEQNDGGGERVPSAALPPRLQQILGQIPPTQRAEIQSVIRQELYAGPLPHPEHLEHFARLIPDGADRLMTLAEKEQAHRHKMEASGQATDQAALSAETKYAMFGMISGSLIGFAFLGAAVYLGVSGHTALAVMCLAPPITGLVTKFINGRPAEKTPPPPQTPVKNKPPKRR